MYTDSIWWKMKLVEATSDTLNESIGDTIHRVKDLNTHILHHCQLCLNIQNKEVQDAAYEVLCDILVAYAPQIAHMKDFESLIVTPSTGILTSFKLSLE